MRLLVTRGLTKRPSACAKTTCRRRNCRSSPPRPRAWSAQSVYGTFGTVRLWNIMAGPGHPALLLGPLAVASDRRNRGIGTRLMRHALREARQCGYRAILLVGDTLY